MIKKSIITAVFVLALSVAALPALADTTSTPSGNDIPQIPAIPAIESAAPQSENIPTATINGINNLAALQARGAALISQRIRGLNRLDQKINKTKLAGADKTALKAEIAANITGLTALGEKIKADTDIAVAKADVISIYETYRIYAVFMPKITGIMNNLLLLQNIEKLTADTVPKFEARIAELKAAGKDVSKLEALMAEAKTKLAEAKTKAETAKAGFSTLRPADYPATKTVIAQNHALTKEAHNALRIAQKDLAKVKTQLLLQDRLLKIEKKKLELQQKLEAKKKKAIEKLEAQKNKSAEQLNAKQQKVEGRFDRKEQKIINEKTGPATSTKK